MMDELVPAMRTALKAKGVPFEVAYGPTQVPPAIGASRIQFQRDYDGGDAFLPPRARMHNPKMRAVIAHGGKVLVHAQSTKNGAQRYDHEKVALEVVKQIRVELDKFARDVPTEFRVVSARFVVDVTLPDGWNGVVYELRFQIDEAVNDVSWVGDAAPEGTYVGGAATTVNTAGSPGTSESLPNATTRIES